MKPRISFITLGVRDLERSRRFYCETLGLTPLDSSPGVVFIDMGSVRLSLWTREQLAEDAGLSSEGSGFPGISLAHNVGSPSEVDELLAHVAANGGTLLKAGHGTFWGGYAGYFADPDGFLWEVAWNPHMPEMV
jgi:catechol 2,3-dioxygenase-like lactoylglutathione lyase family enzyme